MKRKILLSIRNNHLIKIRTTKTSLVINEPFELEAYFRLILGVDEQATKEEIKHAYRQKVMKYHPDKSVEENAKEKYEEIIEAYKYLK